MAVRVHSVELSVSASGKHVVYSSSICTAMNCKQVLRCQYSGATKYGFGSALCNYSGTSGACSAATIAAMLQQCCSL
eukprot:15808-Heterococcus_DN1.PRE.1